MNIVGMLEKVLSDMGAIGLVNGDLECGCEIGDLCPCDMPDLQECVPARHHDPKNAKEIKGYFYPIEA
jgi:hypothetical protein